MLAGAGDAEEQDEEVDDLREDDAMSAGNKLDGPRPVRGLGLGEADGLVIVRAGWAEITDKGWLGEQTPVEDDGDSTVVMAFGVRAKSLEQSNCSNLDGHWRRVNTDGSTTGRDVGVSLSG